MPRAKRENKGLWSDQNHEMLAGKASIFPGVAVISGVT